MSQPYTYLIGWSKLGYWYYGSQYGKKATPKNLWKCYFTSSKLVKLMRFWHGEPDVVQIRRIFKTPAETLIWEAKVLRRMKVLQSDFWLNRNIGGEDFCLTGHSTETRQKQSRAALGKKKSIEHIQKMIKYRTGRKLGPCSEERKQKIGKANRGRKRPDSRIRHSKAVAAYFLNGDRHSSYSSGRDAAKQFGISFQTISESCLGKTYTTRTVFGPMRFSFLEKGVQTNA
jgi:hypothetical protein